MIGIQLKQKTDASWPYSTNVKQRSSLTSTTTRNIIIVIVKHRKTVIMLCKPTGLTRHNYRNGSVLHVILTNFLGLQIIACIRTANSFQIKQLFPRRKI